MTDSTRELPGTREAAEAWESLFRAQVALMRRFPNFSISVLDAAVSANLPAPLN